MRFSLKNIISYTFCILVLYIFITLQNLTVNRNDHYVLQNIIFEESKENKRHKNEYKEQLTSHIKSTKQTVIYPPVRNKSLSTTKTKSLKVKKGKYKQKYIKCEKINKELSFEEVVKELKNGKIFKDITTNEIDEIYNSKKLMGYVRTEIIAKNNSKLKLLFPPIKREPSPHEDRIIQQMTVKLKSFMPKKILAWDPDLSFENTVFTENECPVSSCSFTYKKSDLVDNKVDAILFKSIPEELQRPFNLSNQVWIFYQLESAVHSERINSDLRYNAINWTATYRSDSVITTPYEKFATHAHVKSLPLFPPRNYAEGKTKLVAWFVSNCGALNGRSEYVKVLQQYIKVDIYGLCGPLQCERGVDSCFEMLKKDYKFYLAFENSNCRDYITEKFFVNALSNDVIPIAMGAHPDDYKRLAPPKSYLHVDEFKGPRELAEYLHILDSNDDLYNSYFRWKGTGKFINTKFPCRLCAMLHVAPKFPMWYEDLAAWWDLDRNCHLPIYATGKKWSSWKDEKKEMNSNNLIHQDF